jgi:putative hydrolase of the HAD superfamily
VPNSGRVRAVAFDLFHTIVDPEDFRPKEFLRARAVAELLKLPSPEFEEYWAETVLDRVVAKVPTVTDRVRRYCSSRGILPPDGAWSMVTDILGRYQDLAIRNPRKNVLEGLRRLKEQGLALGLVSNCDEREMRAWPDSVLAPIFDAAVFSCEIGFAKPSVEAYQALVPRWGGIPLDEAIFVGDGSNDELAGARRAGFRHVVFDSEFVDHNGLRSPEANERIRKEADTSIRNLSELESALLS